MANEASTEPKIVFPALEWKANNHYSFISFAADTSAGLFEVVEGKTADGDTMFEAFRNGDTIATDKETVEAAQYVAQANYQSCCAALRPRLADGYVAVPVEQISEPMQPVVMTESGVVRFCENRIVRRLLEASGLNMNSVAIAAAKGEFTDAEQRQFAQLIGYSVSGYGDLSYAEEHWSVDVADERAEVLLALDQEQANG